MRSNLPSVWMRKSSQRGFQSLWPGWLLVAVNRISNLDEPYRDEFEIKVTGADGFEMAPVDVSFFMKAGEEQYHVVFTLSVKDSGETLFLMMSGNKDEKTKTETDTITIADPDSPGGKKEETITTTTYIETYTWNKGIINGIGDTNEAET